MEPLEDDTNAESKTSLQQRLERERHSAGRLQGGGTLPKGIFDQISLVAFVLDCNLRVMRFNAAAERLFGAHFADLLNKPFFEVLPALTDVNHDHAFQRTIALGAPAEVKEIALMDQQRRKQLFFDFEIDPIVDEGGRLAGISVIGLDVTERVKLRRKIARQNEDLIALNQVSNALRRTMDLEKAFVIIASALTSQEGGGYDHAMIFLVDQERQFLTGQIAVDSIGLRDAWAVWRDLTRHDGPLQKTLEAVQPVLARRWGELTRVVRSIKIPLKDADSVIVHAINTGRTVTQETSHEEGLGRLKLSHDLFNRFPMTSFAAAPLLTDTEAIGVMLVDASSRPRRFSPERLTMLEMFANQAALAINNGIMFQNVLERAQRDSLTRLYNHGHFQDTLRMEVERARRYSYPLSVVMIDIDHFKKFNDNYGHQTGDVVLKQLSLVLTAGIRVTDMAARYGGEEFALLLPQTPHENAVDLATRMCAGVARKVVVAGPKGERLNVTASFGVATYPQHAADAATIVAAADEALYAAKRTGRNRVVSAGNMPAIPDGPSQTSAGTTLSGTRPPSSTSSGSSQTSAGTSPGQKPSSASTTATGIRALENADARSTVRLKNDDDPEVTHSFPSDTSTGETDHAEPLTDRERKRTRTVFDVSATRPPRRTDTMPPTIIELPSKSARTSQVDAERAKLRRTTEPATPHRTPRMSKKQNKKK